MSKNKNAVETPGESFIKLCKHLPLTKGLDICILYKDPMRETYRKLISSYLLKHSVNVTWVPLTNRAVTFEEIKKPLGKSYDIIALTHNITTTENMAKFIRGPQKITKLCKSGAVVVAHLFGETIISQTEFELLYSQYPDSPFLYNPEQTVRIGIDEYLFFDFVNTKELL